MHILLELFSVMRFLLEKQAICKKQQCSTTKALDTYCLYINLIVFIVAQIQARVWLSVFLETRLPTVGVLRFGSAW